MLRYKQKSLNKIIGIALIAWLSVYSCRKNEVIEQEIIDEIPAITDVRGFYLLNEGNMGMNSASLDYCDYSDGRYHRNIFAATNPSVVKGLGDVGNDLKIYGGKLYAVMNCSNLVEVMNAADASHITAFGVLNCRYIAFSKGKAYVSSYAGPVQLNDKRLGLVLEFDTVDFHETRRVEVGYQPEEMAIVGDKLYVANSGGYTAGDYDRTVSVISLANFKKIKDIDIAPNLHHLKADAHGDIYVSSRGDYYDNTAKLYVIDTKTDALKKIIDTDVSNFCIAGDTAYIVGAGYNYLTGQRETSFRMVNLLTEDIIDGSYINDGTAEAIARPYGIAVDPLSHYIYLTDAANYLSSGRVYCYNPEGVLQWSAQTGDIPAHFAFLTE